MTEIAVKKHGLYRSEGKDYTVQDGDIINTHLCLN